MERFVLYANKLKVFHSFKAVASRHLNLFNIFVWCECEEMKVKLNFTAMLNHIDWIP